MHPILLFFNKCKKKCVTDSFLLFLLKSVQADQYITPKIVTSMKHFIASLCGLCLLFSCVGSDTSHTLDTVKQMGEEIRKQFIPDKRVGIFDVTYRMNGKQLVLKGGTTSAEAKTMLIHELTTSGYDILDSLRILPDAVELENNTYAIVNLSVCNLRRADDFSSEMITQALLGMPVRVLEHTGWYRIQLPDNYIGWVHRAGITPMTKEEYNAWNRAEKIVVTAHCGFTYEKPNAEAQSVSDVVAGDRLKWVGTEGNYYKVAYPDGRVAYISRTLSVPEKEWRKGLKQDAASILHTAKSLLGVPYLWAGTSSKGMDCSGLVRTVLYMHDIIMPRDASQQAYVGEHIDIAPDFANLAPGDLMFFGRKATADQKERVVHVGIYLGNKKFIHSQGDVRINSVDPNAPEYDEYNLNRLLFATRMLSHIGTPEINTTATNPYYLPQ